MYHALNRSLMFFLTLLLTLGTSIRAQEVTMNVTEASNVILGQKLLFFDTEDPAAKADLYRELNQLFPGHVYAQTDKATLAIVGPVVMMPQESSSSSDEPFMSRSKAGHDMLVGAALCGGGCLAVTAIGKKTDPEKSGFKAMVGSKEVTGGPACLVAVVWVSGLGFLAKGFFELLMSDTKPANGSYYQTDEMIKHAALTVNHNTKLTALESGALIHQAVTVAYHFTDSQRSLAYRLLLAD